MINIKFYFFMRSQITVGRIKSSERDSDASYERMLSVQDAIEINRVFDEDVKSVKQSNSD